jgi:hypothetical protein
MKKNDMILFALLLAVAALSGIWYYMSHRTPALRAEVSIDGKVTEVLDLSKDQEITIQGAKNGTNTLTVKDGEIWCEEASCPDKVCIHQGKQSRDGDIIVCLPNLMIVQIIGKE